MKHFRKTLCVFIAVLMVVMTTAPSFSAFNYASATEDSIIWGGHTYKRFDESMTWKEAKSYCESLGGYLATVTSYAEQTAVMRLIKGGRKAQYWLGATDEAQEGKWEWITGEEWSYKFPNYGFDNAYGVENYLQIMRHNRGNGNALGYWNDSANDNTIKGEEEFFSLENVGFICEFGEKLNCSGETPIVYIIGRTGIYTADGEPTISENTEFITDVIEQCGPELKAAILKGKWDAFSDKVYELISVRYEKYRISNDGEVVDGSHNLWTWNKETLPSRMGDIFTYRFEYDARRDPCAIADDLHEYITAIK